MKIFPSLKQRAIDFLEPYKEKGPATFAAAEQAIGAVLIADGLVGIENPFGAKKRPGIFGTITGMIFGIIFMLVPLFIGTLTNIKNMTESTSATVVSVGDMVRSGSRGGSTCGLEVRYNVGGQEYTQQSAMSSSDSCSLTPGQTISIKYDPKNPGSWAYGADKINLIVYIFFGAGLIALVSSIFTFFIRLFSIIFGWKLLRDGRKNAATLPQGTSLGTIIAEIRKNFISSVFAFGSAQNTVMSALTQTPQTPQPPQTPQSPN